MTRQQTRAEAQCSSMMLRRSVSNNLGDSGVPAMRDCICGRIPHVVKEDDGFWYVLCPGHCGMPSAWSESQREATAKWNQQVIDRLAADRLASQE